MGFEPLEWYCRPVPDGFWAKTSSNALGAYTPCGVETVVLGLSYLVLVGLFSYRMWRTLKDTTIQKFHLKSKTFNYVLGLLALYCTIGPLIRLFMGLSLVNFDGEIGLPPFEIVTLILQSVAWCFVLVMIAVETKIYIREFRWYVRFGLLYLLVAETIMFNIVLPNIKLYDPLVFYTYASGALCELLFGILLLLYIPNLESFTGYMPIPTNNDDTEDYEVLPQAAGTCVFSGTTAIVTVDPSPSGGSSCVYPSISSPNSPPTASPTPTGNNTTPTLGPPNTSTNFTPTALSPYINPNFSGFGRDGKSVSRPGMLSCLLICVSSSLMLYAFYYNH